MDVESPETPETPPVPRPTGNNWMLGCGSGCAVILVVALIAGFVAYRISLRSAEIKRGELRAEIRQEFDALKASGSIAAEHLAFYEAAITASQRPETGLFGLLLYIGGVIEPLKDGELTGEELELARDTHAFLLANPAPGPMDFAGFIEERPRLQWIIEDMAAR